METKTRKLYLFGGLLFILGITIGWLISPSAPETTDAEHNHGVEALANQIWTCSMHPQIKLNEPGDCPICGMDLIPMTTGKSSGNTNPLAHEMSPEAVAMANVQTSIVGGMNSDGELRLTGKIQADERQNASVTAKFPGRIEKLNVSFTGEKVRAGQLLATIYSPELVTAQKELLEAAKTRSVFPELYQAAREKLRLWKLSDAQISSIETSGTTKTEFDVLAERSGIVTQRNISVGDYVSTGTVLFSIVDLDKIWVMLDAYESDLPLVAIGNPISFEVAGIPGQTFTAKVTYIDPILNPNTRAASLRAEIANPGGKLLPEMFVNAKIKTNAKGQKSGIAIPRTALLWSGKRSIVYVKVPNSEYPTFEMREITIGSKMGDMYAVEAGLEVGEEIVTNGVFAIDAASQLAGGYSMMNRPVKKTVEVSPAFQSQLTQLTEEYFKVKNSLVNDDASATQKAAASVQSSLSKVDMNLVKGAAHDRWMSIMSEVSKASGMISKETDIEKQRSHFAPLSQAFLDLTETFGLTKDKVYKEFCPMAFDNKGAYWLSESSDIRNPYYGQSMLTCGEVKATYLKGQPVMDLAGTKPVASSGEHNH
ncbi:Cu(I)/Ag(I) efflux system membrane fusion protein [Algoriphagus ratkowskyi]|uniref:Cu(I)/Ag(I) efflux system membrane fusion protein n=1 Tax=Algoriphagus ratkowskyi TaxID=57028 RepID=A0A2W7SP07_9BACT|nr:efflux RND transporter periplasmic adaptor subunit [Algoriphagus ratkowskyi]PZX52482.1 Cu(I)/Ag(I) efflux system membrane fusion protein [Algoriphagus ratkowskyi]TXD76175.1 efflux RND transporter periplasmic adaptor subunit [Algoriphagus ratkowskyi]